MKEIINMKKILNFKCIIYSLIIINIYFLFSCNTSISDTKKQESKAPIISNNGETIKIDKESTDQISSEEVNKKVIISEMKAPCKIILSAINSNSFNTNTKSDGIISYLYESTDLSDLIAEYSKTKTSIDKISSLVERLKDLVEHHAAPIKDLLDAETELSQLRTSLLSTENKLVVTGLNPKNSLNITGGKVLVIGDIPESQVGKLKTGSSVNICFNSFPGEKITSKITGVGGVIDPLTRTMKVQVILDNKSGKLVPGLYGQMILDLNEESAVAVPTNSVFTAKGKSFLFLETNPGEYHRKEIMTGVISSDYTEILNGVKQGDKVVNKGIVLLKSLSFGY